MTAATNTTVATANTTTPPAISHAHTSQHHQNNVLTEQQRRILKRPSSSPSQSRRQTPTSITTITLDDDPDTEELPSTSKDSKQPKIEVEMVPLASVASEADVVDHHVTAETDSKEEHHQQQPLINSTCDKIEPSECSGEVAIVAMDQDDEDVVELVQPAMAAIAAVTPAKAVALPESLPTNPEVVNQFVSYFQSVELAAGEFDSKVSISSRFHCFLFIFI